MTKSDYVRDYMKINPGLSRAEITDGILKENPSMFASRKHAGSVVQNVFKAKTIPVQSDVAQNGAELTKDQLRSMLNIRNIVINELNKIERGKFWPDGAFVRRFQGKSGYRNVLDSPETVPYRGKGDGKIFWGHPESIYEMKNEGTLI